MSEISLKSCTYELDLKPLNQLATEKDRRQSQLSLILLECHTFSRREVVLRRYKSDKKWAEVELPSGQH